MNHHELLAKIDYYLQPTIELTGEDKIKNSAIGFMKALRAVVELHKPKEFDDGDPKCMACETIDWYRVYPCPTIQAIQKELK